MDITVEINKEINVDLEKLGRALTRFVDMLSDEEARMFIKDMLNECSSCDCK